MTTEAKSAAFAMIGVFAGIAASNEFEGYAKKTLPPLPTDADEASSSGVSAGSGEAKRLLEPPQDESSDDVSEGGSLDTFDEEGKMEEDDDGHDGSGDRGYDTMAEALRGGHISHGEYSELQYERGRGAADALMALIKGGGMLNPPEGV